jgi:hypothetical protein
MTKWILGLVFALWVAPANAQLLGGVLISFDRIDAVEAMATMSAGAPAAALIQSIIGTTTKGNAVRVNLTLPSPLTADDALRRTVNKCDQSARRAMAQPSKFSFSIELAGAEDVEGDGSNWTLVFDGAPQGGDEFEMARCILE